jgi:hypothetical protein
MKKEDLILYFNGDSYVAGTELADPYFFPSITHKFKEMPNKRPSSNLTELKSLLEIKKTISLEKIYQVEKEKSFPGKVCSSTGIETINAGKAASSLDRIARRTIEDLLVLKKKEKKIVAFIGITEPSRFEFPNPLNNNETDFWECLIPGYGFIDKFKLVNPVLKYKAVYEKDYHLISRMVRNLIYIKSFCLANSIDFYFVDTWSFDLEKYKDLISKNNRLSDMIEYLDLKFLFKMSNFIENVKLPYCLGGHFTEEVHEITANFLSDFLIEKYINE